MKHGRQLHVPTNQLHGIKWDVRQLLRACGWGGGGGGRGGGGVKEGGGGKIVDCYNNAWIFRYATMYTVVVTKQIHGM